MEREDKLNISKLNVKNVEWEILGDVGPSLRISTSQGTFRISDYGGDVTIYCDDELLIRPRHSGCIKISTQKS